MEMTTDTKELFEALAKDAPNWGGTPGLGCSVPSNAKTRGHVTDLKKKGLVTTFNSDGITWVQFTPRPARRLQSNSLV
jgi:hypothetical protein